MVKFGDLVFCDKEHFYFYLERCKALGKKQSVYHEAFFYTVGISFVTREHWKDLYDFESHSIKLEGLHRGWQTGATTRLTRLAFNLFNGWCEDGHENLSTPYNLFDCEFGPYFWTAIKLRYPEFCGYIM